MIFLETARLRLRNVSKADADEMFDYRNDPVCARYQRGQRKELADIVALTERRKNDALTVDAPAMVAVALKESDKIIGEIVVMPNEGTISFGYTFSYKIHRQGYAHEALSALMAHLHECFPQWDYVCFTDRENLPSMALLKKLGFTDLGYLPSKDSQVFGKWLRPDTAAEIAEAAGNSK